MSDLIQHYKREHLTYWGSFSHATCQKLTKQVWRPCWTSWNSISLSLESTDRALLFIERSRWYRVRLLVWFSAFSSFETRYASEMILLCTSMRCLSSRCFRGAHSGRSISVSERELSMRTSFCAVYYFSKTTQNMDWKFKTVFYLAERWNFFNEEVLNNGSGMWF